MCVRKVSEAEVRWAMGDCFKAYDGDSFAAPIAGSDVKLAFSQILPLDHDAEPMWPQSTAHSKTDPRVISAITPYEGITSIAIWSGYFDDQTFRLVAPGDAAYALLQMGWSLDSTPDASHLSLKSEFALRHQALWSCRYVPGVDESDKSGRDFWVIPVGDALQPILDQHQDNYNAKLKLAEESLRQYDQNKDFYRRCIEEFAQQCLSNLGWGLVMYSDFAELYFIDGDGVSQADYVRYDEHNYNELVDLFCIAEEADAGGHVGD